MNSAEFQSIALNGAGSSSEGPAHFRFPTVRQGGPGRRSASARGVCELLSDVSGVSAEREDGKEVVRMFAAQPMHNQKGRVCDFCNKIWLCRAEHRHCVNTMSDERRARVDARVRLRREDLVLGSRLDSGLRRSWRLKEESARVVEDVKKEMEFVCGCCGQGFGEAWQDFQIHVERDCKVFSFHG